MKNKDITETLQELANNALEDFRDGSLNFSDYEFAVKVPYRLDFDEWISDLEDYLHVDPKELQGENRFETIKRFFSTINDNRLRQLIDDPKSISEDESLEWRRSLYEDDQEDADFLILLPLALPLGETGSAIICSYTNIPGGEHELVEVFPTVEEGEKYLVKNCF